MDGNDTGGLNTPPAGTASRRIFPSSPLISRRLACLEAPVLDASRRREPELEPRGQQGRGPHAPVAPLGAGGHCPEVGVQRAAGRRRHQRHLKPRARRIGAGRLMLLVCGSQGMAVGRGGRRVLTHAGHALRYPDEVLAAAHRRPRIACRRGEGKCLTFQPKVMLYPVTSTPFTTAFSTCREGAYVIPVAVEKRLRLELRQPLRLGLDGGSEIDEDLSPQAPALEDRRQPTTHPSLCHAAPTSHERRPATPVQCGL